MPQTKVPDEKILESYSRLKNVWKVGDEVGLCGQTVHQRLTKLGSINRLRILSDEDREIILKEYQEYADAGKLSELALRLNRDKPYICMKARELGLTNPRRKKLYSHEETAKRVKKYWQENGHPRGMLGKKHTEETKARIGATSAQKWASMSIAERRIFCVKRNKASFLSGKLYPPRLNASWKAAWREIGGVKKFYRSRWEANYARYLEWLKRMGNIRDWQHEPETFWFDKIRRGSASYLPDFKVTSPNGTVAYHEVKGWMDARSKTKLKRMKKYHPSVVIVLIEKKEYMEIKRKVSRLIEGWED